MVWKRSGRESGHVLKERSTEGKYTSVLKGKGVPKYMNEHYLERIGWRNIKHLLIKARQDKGDKKKKYEEAGRSLCFGQVEERWECIGSGMRE